MYTRFQTNSDFSKGLYIIGFILLLQYYISQYSILLAGLLPFILHYLEIGLINLLIKYDETGKLQDKWKIHAVEHMVAKVYWNQPVGIISWGCGNVHMIFWLVVNLILIWFLPVPIATILSAIIAGEINIWFFFNQNSWLANKLYPLIFITQSWTLDFPDVEHYKIAHKAMCKLKEVENAKSV